MSQRRLPPGIVAVEPGVGQESVWDYPRPPRIDPVAARIRVVVAGRTIADTLQALRVVETAGAPVYYLPPADIDLAHLRPTDHSSVCEWKGVASYFDHDDEVHRIPAIAWAYRRPEPGYGAIRDHLAFYASRVDEAWVGGERARPQPGGFYGGWVTDAIVGPIKGEPGSQFW